MYNKETICVQGNYKPGNGEPRVLPLYQSTTFKYSSIDQLAELFDLKVDGHIYSRISNPTIQALKKNKFTRGWSIFCSCIIRAIRKYVGSFKYM